MSSADHSKHDSYPVDCYISYARSIALGIERQVIDNPPRRPADFWRMCEKEIGVARWRMRNVSGQIRKLGSAKANVS